MKGTTEPRVRAALTRLSDDMDMLIYKPPDDARNRKPADFLVWYDSMERPLIADYGGAPLYAASAFIEVKDNPQLATYPFSDLRPQQRQAMRRAAELFLPYWVVMWWRRAKVWTVSRGDWMIEAIDREAAEEGGDKSFSLLVLSSTMGVDCIEAHLPSTLGAALRGEIG